MEVFENKYVKLWIEDGIMIGVYQPGAVLDLQAAKEIVEGRLAFANGKVYPVLIDFSNLKSVNKEARDYMNSPDGGLRGLNCGAFVGGNVLATLFINMYLRVSKPTLPSKFFTDRQQAIDWLRTMRVL